MMIWAPLVLAAVLSPQGSKVLVEGHGFLESPRSRNFYAHEVGPVCPSSDASCPPAEYCHHCLNTNAGVCGSFNGRNYDNWVNKNGATMPWNPDGATYTEGGTMLIKSYLDTHHNGHMEIRACKTGTACVTDNDPAWAYLEFVQDPLYGMPKDTAYPERGMYAGGQGGGIKDFEFEYLIPMGISGDKVLLQWKYITANSCSPPGYSSYFRTHSTIPSTYWTSGLTQCTLPYPSDGTRGTTWPEQFFNCAEVTILSAAPTTPRPTAAPTTKSPTSAPTTRSPSFVQPPTSPPTPGSTCISQWGDCTYAWSSCCTGLKCTQVDQAGYGRCLSDTCNPTAAPPTPPPTPPTPTPPTPTAPTQPPTPPTGFPPGRGCCSINLKTCHHDAGTFCWESKDNCEGPCGKTWLPTGAIDGCTAMWEPCTTDEDCCLYAKCDASRGYTCYAAWQPNPDLSPTPRPTTGAPTSKPIPSPTSPPTMPSPTTKPTSSPTHQPTVPVPTKQPITAQPVTPAPVGTAFPAVESGFVRVNQVGYLRDATKIGVVVDDSTASLQWQIQDLSGSVLLSGMTDVFGDDAASQDHVHRCDFSSLTDLGSYLLVVDGVGSSLVFEIAPSLYPNLPHEAMNYFYFHRLGEDIDGQYLIDDRYARAALHPGDSSVPPYNGWCSTCANFDLKGSWADAGDFGIYTVNHAISAWTLLNLHELFPEAFVDGELNIPESGNSFPDVLDEVDYGSRFVRGMLPSDGGLASHKAHNHAWSDFTITIAGENALQSSRSAMGSSTPATYAVARVNAQLARMWSGKNSAYAQQLWHVAVDAWERAYGTSKVYSASEASPGPAIGGGDYPDGNIGDDRYAAACEMYLTALVMDTSNMQTYKTDMMSSSYFKSMGQWDWATVAGAGTLSLYAVENDLLAADKASIEANIVAFANKIVNSIGGEGYPSNLNFQEFGSKYPWGSNSFIMNRAIALAYAYEITGDRIYQDHILQTLDYIMGVNAMHISYVTGYGEKAETDTHDRWAWTVGQDAFWPKGWLSGGPNNELINDYETPNGVAAAKSYAAPGTAPHAWGSKENTVNWNAPLAWVAWYVENKIVPNFGGCDGNCAPQADPLSVKVQMNTPISLVLTASDYDGSVASWSIIGIPQLGTLSGDAPNLVYTPNSGVTGTDSFTFKVTDDSGLESNVASVTIQVRNCDYKNNFEVPSTFPNLVAQYNHVHVSEDGPSLKNTKTPLHRIQWQNPGLYQFSLEFTSNPYYLDLNSCMTSKTFSDSTGAGFTLNGCGVSGLDGDYWIAQNSKGDEIWVEKNNMWAIVFSNDPTPPEFCRTSGTGPSTSPPPTAGPTTAFPTKNPTNVPTMVPTSPPMAPPTFEPTVKPVPSPTSIPTMSPTSQPTAKPVASPTTNPTSPPTKNPTSPPTKNPTSPPTKNPTSPPTSQPTVKPVSGGTLCCADRNSGYQQCSTNSWCNQNVNQCNICQGQYISVPLVRTGCCSWGGDCKTVDPAGNPGCQYLKSDCEGSCGGKWQAF